MKKFYWLLLFIILFAGCSRKADTVISKLENNSSSYTKLQKQNLQLFCSDIDEILSLKKEESLSASLSKSEADRINRFKAEHGEYIKKHSIEESVTYLKTPYHMSNLNTSRVNSQKIQKFLKDRINFPKEQNVINYKIINLQLIMRRNTSVTFKPYYSAERTEILNNNDLEWQKKKYKEIVANIMEQVSRFKRKTK